MPPSGRSVGECSGRPVRVEVSGAFSRVGPVTDDNDDDALDFDLDQGVTEQGGPGLFDFDESSDLDTAGEDVGSADAPDDPATSIERDEAWADQVAAADAEGPSVAEVGAASPGLAPPAAPVRAPRAQTPDAPLALYRRYRPDTFADVIGQEHVTEPLQRALANNKVNHAYLFSGPRGCGKTTSARILARALNCEQGPTPTPCGECLSCRELARGGSGSIDVIEIDAASHGGVDDARDLRERAFFAPVNSRYKIYIVDEAHMVTSAGFNALLKLVEEPPPHVKFIFATTEPEKVIGTIRSRTHHYPFRLVPPKVLSGYLGRLCEAEGVPVDDAVLPLVVRAGAGSVRDSLSVLDQLLGGAGEGGVSYDQAASLLGFTPDTLLDEIMDAFAAGDAKGVFATIDKVIEVGQDPRRFAEDLLRRLRDLVIVAAVPDAMSSGLIDVAGDQADRLTVQAQGLGAGELTRAAEVIAQGLTDMRGTTAPRLHLELMCARVLLPGADVDGRGVHARLDRLERRLADTGVPVDRQGAATQPEPLEPKVWPDQERVHQGRPGHPVTPGHAAAAETVGPPTPGQERPVEQPPSPASQAHQSQSDERPADQPPESPTAEQQPRSLQRAPGPRAATPPPTDESTKRSQAQVPPGTIDVTRLRAEWPRVLEEVRSRRRFSWILLSQNAQVLDVTDGVLTLGFANPGARDNYTQGGTPDVLLDSLVEVLGANLHVNAVVDGTERSHAARGGQPTHPSQQPSGRTAPDAGRQQESARHLHAVPDTAHPSAVGHDLPAEPPHDPDEDPDPAGGPFPPDRTSPAQATDAALPNKARTSRPSSQPGASEDSRREHVRRAKEAIRPMARGSSTAGSPTTPQDDADEDVLAEDDDPVIDSGESAHELIAKHLGGTVIEEG
ncbi:DNA polymerase III subunit gamma and tau [Aestuariimicrobium sp. T2.26MG-19.2B]|uniref:DNA polymerase III subunit gamma and tau n=1 Tax=Aestuariimicrobium sp. T2.26MG-19.2B TaxID=3040679 RepID=UPI00247741CC|nr:Holliday junction ATP-dependent DNA helicase RuvB [Aestuariimicrobium sp. T2.26MG-19.2B]